MPENVTPVTDDTFRTEVLESELPVLVDFWAPWCGPCRMVSPVVDEIAGQLAGRVKVVKVNTDENPRTAVTYGIMSIPTLMVVKNGEVQSSQPGARPKQSILAQIEPHLA